VRVARLLDVEAFRHQRRADESAESNVVADV
jgi:hypothetical protein